jgi:hypothetical protein
MAYVRPEGTHRQYSNLFADLERWQVLGSDTEAVL